MYNPCFVFQEAAHLASDQEDWNSEIQRELEEAKEEWEENLEEQTKRYEEKLIHWRNTHRKWNWNFSKENISSFNEPLSMQYWKYAHLINWCEYSNQLSDVSKFFSDKRKEARKRQKQRQKDAEKGEGSADLAEIAQDEEILQAPEQEKPEEPGPFREDLAKIKVWW